MNCESASVIEPEGEDAGGVCDRDRGAEQNRMPRPALRADEIAGHQRLAVARRERVAAPQKAAMSNETRIIAGERCPRLISFEKPVSATLSGACRAIDRGQGGRRPGIASRLEVAVAG